MNNTKIEIINNDFPYRKRIVDIFQECLLNHSFWVNLPNSSSRLKKIKVAMDSDLPEEGCEDYIRWTKKFNLVLINIPLCHCIKHNILKEHKYFQDVSFSYEDMYKDLKEEDFDLGKLNKFLNREIGRIIDMLDPRFGYLKLFDNTKLRSCFTALWNCYIDGRLSQNKIPLLHSKQQTLNNLESIYGYSNDKLFNKIWKSNSFTYEDLIEESRKAYLVRRIRGKSASIPA